MEDREPKVEVLPAAGIDGENNLMYSFKAISADDDDETTTDSDLGILNNHLAMNQHALKNARSVMSICALANTACKLIETRRKVKKLAYGQGLNSRFSRAIEVLE